jgi:hypothetical protein
MIFVDSLCSQSRRVSATRACTRATFARALARLPLPFSLRLRAFCALRSFRSARRRNRGFATLRPSDRTAKWVSPRSMPASRPAPGNGSSPVSTTKLAKYRPAASMITVTLDGRLPAVLTGLEPGRRHLRPRALPGDRREVIPELHLAIIFVSPLDTGAYALAGTACPSCSRLWSSPGPPGAPRSASCASTSNSRTRPPDRRRGPSARTTGLKAGALADILVA